MTIEELNNELLILRNKWKSSWPINDRDPRWWSFRIDKMKAEQIKTQIKKIEAGIPLESIDLTDDQLKDIFK